MAWSGPSAPTHPRFRVPVVGRSGQVVGLLEVESEMPDAFGAEDHRCLEECAALLVPLWG